MVYYILFSVSKKILDRCLIIITPSNDVQEEWLDLFHKYAICWHKLLPSVGAYYITGNIFFKEMSRTIDQFATDIVSGNVKVAVYNKQLELHKERIKRQTISFDKYRRYAFPNSQHPFLNEAFLDIEAKIVQTEVKIQNVQFFTDYLENIKIFDKFVTSFRDNFKKHQLSLSSGDLCVKSILSEEYLSITSKLQSAADVFKDFNDSKLFKNVLKNSFLALVTEKEDFEFIIQMCSKLVSETKQACVQIIEPYCSNKEIILSDMNEFIHALSNSSYEVDLLAIKLGRTISPWVRRQLDNFDNRSSLAEKANVICSLLQLFNISAAENSEEIDMLRALCHINKSSTTESLQKLDRFVVILDEKAKFTDEEWNAIKILLKCGSVLDFVREILDVDIRILTDAVEEHSENFVTESTVADFIHVKQFLQQLVKEKYSNVNHFLLRLTECFKLGIKGLDVKLINCSENCNNIRALFKTVTDKGEITKEIIRAVLDQGEYIFTIDTDDNSVVAKVQYFNEDSRKETEHKLTSLNDIKGRACIMTFDADVFENNKIVKVRQDDVDEFVKQVDAVNGIVDLLSKLRQKGHFGYQYINVHNNGLTLSSYLLSLGHELDVWEKTLKSVREQHTFLNFIFSSQLWTLYSSSSRKKIEIMKFFNRNAELSWLSTKTLSNKDGLSAKEQLQNLAIALDESFYPYRNSKRQSIINIDSERLLDLIVRPGEVYIAALDLDSKNVVATILSLYRNTTHFFPEAHELLICDKQTSLDEFDIFLSRCARSDKLHCVACVENLDMELQYELANRIGQFQMHSKLCSFQLAIILRSVLTHSLLLTLPKHVHHPPLEGRQIFKSMFESLPVKITVFISDFAGQGKTEAIRLAAAEDGYGVKTLPIYQLDSKFDIVNRLRALQLKQYDCLHLDVKCEWSSFLDTLIFELVTVCCIHSATTIFHLSSKIIFIEMSNSANDPKLHGFIVSLLPMKYISWENYNNFLITDEIDSDLQVVCNYLSSYYCKINSDVYFSKLDRDEVKFQKLNPEICRTLLRQAFGDMKEMTFINVHTFVSVLAQQIRRFARSHFFKPRTLRSMVGHKKASAIRSQVMSALITTAADFAKRCIKNTRKSQQFSLYGQTTDNMEAVVTRMEGIVSWHDTNHLLVLFHATDSQTVSAIYRLLEHVPSDIKNLFENQMSEELPDLKALSQENLQEILTKLVKLPIKPSTQNSNSPNHLLGSENDDIEYALTTDNVLKMVLITTRLQAGLPVVIMGETGCGKTTLVRYLAQTCKVQLDSINIHAGYTLEKLYIWLLKKNKEAMLSPKTEIWLFMDEINTCDHLAFLSDFICHRQLFGQLICPNIKIIAACNPYRLREVRQTKTAGIDSKFAPDAFARLAYRVHPLPENLLEYVWDYGSLTEDDESMYIHKMISDGLKGINLNDIDLYVKLIITSQHCIRKIEGNKHCVSLRDVYRTKTLIHWFTGWKKANNADFKYMPIVLALAHCFMSRLASDQNRKLYLENLSNCFSNFCITLSADKIIELLRQQQDEILLHMELPRGIARNTALRENVFIVMVCILNRIPVFLVGKPGCSKSLSMQLIRSNLRGKDSKNKYFYDFPQLYVVSFQGSETSTSDGIEKVFEKATRYQIHTKDTNDVLPVVLLDEVGLAEVSKFNPLKVLHSLLEPPGRGRPDVAVVGISNWALDAAKMNRVVYLSRSDPTIEELADTAKAIATGIDLDISQHEDLFIALATAYDDYMVKQPRENFHGLRDYYYLLKYIVSKLKHDTKVNLEDVVQKGLCRNFGGHAASRECAVEIFCKHLKLNMISTITTWELIEENIQDENSRHLMVVSKGDIAIDGLMNLISEQRQCPIIYGSSFEDDKVDEYNYRILNKIILYMETDTILILKDLDSVYGSLYDLFNQNYVKVGEKHYCRIALGPYSNPMCHVHSKFRCIVLMDDEKILKADKPFLNRFEKQFVDLSHIRTPEVTQLEKDILQFCCNIVPKAANKLAGNVLVAQSPEMLTSLAIAAYKKHTADSCLKYVKEKILWLILPHIMLQAANSNFAYEKPNEFRDILEQYFELPLFNGLNNLIINMLDNSLNDETNEKIIVFTYSALSSQFLLDSYQTQVENLSTFKTRKDLEGRLESFWSNTHATLLIVHCQWPEDDEHYLLCKLLMESAAKDKSKNTSFRKHMVLIVHINQNDPTSSVPMCSFLWGWKIIAVESLNSPPGFPGIPQFLRSNICNILTAPLQGFQNNLIKQLVIDLFPQAFSRITYQPSDLRDMLDIAALIDIARKNELFVQICSNYIMRENFSSQTFVASELIHGVPKWLLQIATSEQQIARYLTFIDAIYGFFEDIILHSLSAIVFALENHSGWPDFNNFGKLSFESVDKEWEERLCYIMKQLNTSFICTEPVIQLHIPFSKFLFDKFAQYKKRYLDECIEFEESLELNPSNCDSVMISNAKSLNSLNDKYQSIFSSFLLTESFWHSVFKLYPELYVNDFCILTVQKRTRCPDDKEIIAWMRYLLKGKLLSMNIELSDEHFPSLMHFITWLNEDFFHNCLELITTLKKLKCLLSLNFDQVQNDSFWNVWLHKLQTNKNGLHSSTHELPVVQNQFNIEVDVTILNDEQNYPDQSESAYSEQNSPKLHCKNHEKSIGSDFEESNYNQNYENKAICYFEHNEIVQNDDVLAEKHSNLSQHETAFVQQSAYTLLDQPKMIEHQNNIIGENKEGHSISYTKNSFSEMVSSLQNSLELTKVMENQNFEKTSYNEDSSVNEFKQNEVDFFQHNTDALLDQNKVREHQNIEADNDSDSSSDFNHSQNETDFVQQSTYALLDQNNLIEQQNNKIEENSEGYSISHTKLSPSEMNSNLQNSLECSKVLENRNVTEISDNADSSDAKFSQNVIDFVLNDTDACLDQIKVREHQNVEENSDCNSSSDSNFSQNKTDFALQNTNVPLDQINMMQYQNIGENNDNDGSPDTLLSQNVIDTVLQNYPAHAEVIVHQNIEANDESEKYSDKKISHYEKDLILQNTAVPFSRNKVMEHQNNNFEGNSHSDNSSDTANSDQLDFDHFGLEDNKRCVNKRVITDNQDVQINMLIEGTHVECTNSFLSKEINDQHTLLDNRAYGHSLQSKFNYTNFQLGKSTNDFKYLYLDNCEVINVNNQSSKQYTSLEIEENIKIRHVASQASCKESDDDNYELENIGNAQNHTKFVLSQDADSIGGKLEVSNSYEFSDFSKAFLFKVLLPIINPNNLSSLNAGRIVCLARAAAVRVNDEFAMLDFLDIIRHILSLNNGNGQFIATSNHIKDFVSSFKQSSYTLTSDDCLQALHALLTYLYTVTDDQRRQLRVTLLIFLRVLESDDDMPNLQKIVQICLQLVCQLKDITFFRPILQRIIRSYDLTEEENDFNSIGEAGQRLHEMLYSNLSNIYEDMASVTDIEQMIDHCHDNIRSQIWMLILQIMNVKSFTTITNETLCQSLVTSAYQPLLAAFEKALHIIKDAGPVNLQRLVAARYIRAFLDALAPSLCDIKKLENDQYDWLLDHLSNLFSPFIGVDGPEGKIKAIVIFYLLKILRHQMTWKDWRYMYELLRKKMRCISVLPDINKKYSLIQWYPFCPSDSFASFVNNHYSDVLNYIHGENDDVLTNICHNSFQNVFDLILICRLTLQSDNDCNKVMHAIIESYPKSNNFKTHLIESVCKLSFTSVTLNITADMSNNDLFKALVALEVAKCCIMQQELNKFVDNCFFDQCMHEEIPLLEELVNPHESCHFYNCSCNYRIGFRVNAMTNNCALCNQKLIKSDLTTVNQANSIGMISMQITMKILNFLSCSMILVSSSVSGKSANRTSLSLIEDRFQAAWTDLLKSFPENEEFLCKLLHLVVAQTVTFTCEQEYPKAKHDRFDWLKSFHSACQQLICYRHSSVQNAEVKRCVIMEELKKEYWEEKLHEIDFLMVRVTDAYEDSCALFFSLQACPSELHFELSFKLSDNSNWPFLFLFFEWKDKLALIKCLLSIWRWHLNICSTANYQHSRMEIKDLTVHDVIHKYEHLAVPLKAMRDDIQILLNASFITAEEFAIVDDKSFIADLLITDSSSKLLQILTSLVDIQNDFLDQVAYLATANDCFCLEYIKWYKDISMIPVMHISRLNKSAVIDYEWSDDYLDFAQNNTSYGLGFEIFYDYETIEARLARELLFGKSHIVNELTMTHFHFRDEMSMSGHTLITDVENLVKQCPLSHNQKERLNKEISSQLRQYFSMTLQVVWMLKLTGGSKEDVLCSYIQTWKNAMPRSVAKDCQRLDNSLQLQHIASFYQQLELLLAKKNMFEGDVHPFKISLGAFQKPTADTLRQPGIPLKDILDVLHRLLFRLTSNKIVVNAKDQLKDYLCDVTLWEYGLSVEAKINSINKLDANYYPGYYFVLYLAMYYNILSIQKIILRSNHTCYLQICST